MTETDMLSYREDITTIAIIEKLARSWDETRTNVMQKLVRSGLESSKALGLLRGKTVIRRGVKKDIEELYNSCVFLGESDEFMLKIDSICTILEQKHGQKLHESEILPIKTELITKFKLIKMSDKAYFDKLKPIMVKHKKLLKDTTLLD